MQIKQLVKIKRSIEKFFFKMRYNVGLESILSSVQYENFRKKIEQSLEDQILYYAKFEKINNIIGLKKNQYESKDTQLKENLEKIWLPLVTIMEEDEIREYLKYVADISGQISLDSITSGAKFSLTNKSLLRNIDSRIEEFIGIVDNTTKDWITRHIEQGITNKMNSFDIAKMLRDDAPDVAFERSLTISEYETAYLYGQITKEVFKRNGINEIRWVTAKDERVCPICFGNEEIGKIRIGNKFPSGVDVAPAHVGCRCFVIPAQSGEVESKWIGS